MLDRCFIPNTSVFNYQYFYESIEEDYPGWIKLEKTIKRFLEKFTSVDKYYPHPKIIWSESESESESEYEEVVSFTDQSDEEIIFTDSDYD